ncbi:MAG: rRNA cytosine-C5-methyltransferase [Bacteroidota bacterium]
MDLPRDFWSQLTYLSDKERMALEASFQEKPTIAMRLNGAKWSQKPIHPPVPWNDQGYYLETRPFFTADPLFHAGAYYVQEPSSMVIGTLIRDLLQSMDGYVRVLDLCGAPGGKSTDIAQHLRKGDMLLSNEVIGSRVQTLKENTIKWGRANHHISHNDPKDFQKLPGFFDIVVVDAPCSGEGLFRKDPNSVSQWSLQAVDFCQQRQLRILEDVWDTLAEGGVLIYSTCTLNEKENEEVLGHLVSTYDVSPVQFHPPTEWSFMVSDVGDFQQFKVLPHLSRGEGFSFFLLRKVEPTRSIKLRHRKGRKRPSKADYGELFEGMEGRLHAHEDFVLFYDHEDLLRILSEHLRMVKRGTLVGTMKKGRLVPAHEWALSTDLGQEQWPAYDLSYDEAIRFLRKDVLMLPMAERGFATVRYRGQPLGWINHLGNRVNNLYPSEYRISAEGDRLTEPEVL